MKKYGLIGYPLKHSFSYRYFADKFSKENIVAEYNNYEISNVDLLPEIIANDTEVEGLNVTIPYKEDVIKYLDELDHTAQAIGAVNVIKVIRNHDRIYLKGYNSDVIGFTNSIKPLLDKNIHQKALILGTGGAAKAVAYGLKQLGIDSKYVSRQDHKEFLKYDDLSEKLISEYKIIINATPIGTFPKDEHSPDIPYQYLTSDHLLYDLVYNPPLTKFLLQGEEKGAKIKNGYEMLELQALAAWDIWND